MMVRLRFRLDVASLTRTQQCNERRLAIHVGGRLGSVVRRGGAYLSYLF
jgi:hypothetical protein